MNIELEHGKSYVSIDGDFNKEGMIQSIEELKSVIESFNQKNLNC